MQGAIDAELLEKRLIEEKAAESAAVAERSAAHVAGIAEEIRVLRERLREEHEKHQAELTRVRENFELQLAAIAQEHARELNYPLS